MTTLRQAVREVMQMQSPLHLAIIHERVQNVLGRSIRSVALSKELGGMVDDGEIRRMAGGMYTVGRVKL